MKLISTRATLVVASFTLLGTTAHAQFVKGNEAVTVTAAGKKVETPPVPASIGALCLATEKCLAGSWRMVETVDGLVECTEPQARPGSCRASTFGSQKLPRLWVVKKGNTWLQCQYPDLGSKCTDIFGRPPANLAYPAVQ